MQVFEITSDSTTVIRNQFAQSGIVNYIRLTNAHTSGNVTIDLFLEDSSGNTYVVAKTEIPFNATLLLDEHLSFSTGEFSLKLTTTSGTYGANNGLTVIVG
tara:strand:+ start:695 stop:997 length:303 start_codon:yes stop_codon:yes gene_type:complete